MVNNMVNSSGVLDATYAALAHPARRGMLSQLRAEPLRVTDLAASFDISLPAVSRHVRVLQEADLITRAVHGRDHRLSLRAQPLQEAAAWIDAYRGFWTQRLDALEAHLEQR